MGLRGSPTAELAFDGVRVPAANRIGAEGDGFGLAMQTFERSRPGIAAQAVGIAQGALEVATAYAQERQQFGQRIGDFQMVAAMLADMDAATEAARQLLYKACAEIEAGSPDAGRWSAMCKLVAGDAAMRVTTDAVQVLGGYGYIDEFPVERMMRDAKITQLYEGTQQIQRLVDRAGAARQGRLTGGEVHRFGAHRRPREARAGPGVRRQSGWVRMAGSTGRRCPAVVNGNDEYALEAALKLDRGRAAARSRSSRWRRRTPPRRCARRWRWAPRAASTSPIRRSAGSCAVSTARVLAAALARRSSSTSSSPASTRPTASAASCRPAVAAQLGLPYLSYAARIEPDDGRRHGPRPPDLARRATTCSRRRCPRVIACTQALGEPRYPSLKGIMAARSKEIVTRSLADLGLDAADGRWRRGDDDGSLGDAAAAGPARRTRGRSRHAGRGRRPDRRVPRRTEAHLMGAHLGRRRARPGWRASPGSAPRSPRWRATSATPAGARSSASWSRRDPDRLAGELWRTYLPRRPDRRRIPRRRTDAWSAVAAGHVRGFVTAARQPRRRCLDRRRRRRP